MPLLPVLTSCSADIHKGEKLHVHGARPVKQRWNGLTVVVIRVDDRHGQVITCPDMLVSTTTVSSAFQCHRRSVLDELCRTTRTAKPCSTKDGTALIEALL